MDQLFSVSAAEFYFIFIVSDCVPFLQTLVLICSQESQTQSLGSSVSIAEWMIQCPLYIYWCRW